MSPRVSAIVKPLFKAATAVSLCFSDDILQGAELIARFMFGDSPGGKRQVYRLATEVSAPFRLPTFKMGSNTLCACKSSILRWIEQQENARTAAKEEVA
jgi:hypothetical protein